MVQVVGVLQRDDVGRRRRVDAELGGGSFRVGEQARLVGRVDPGARDDASTVGRRAGDKPVDAADDRLARQDALLDQELLDGAGAQRSGGDGCGDRLGVVVVIVVVTVMVVIVIVAHTASSQCS